MYNIRVLGGDEIDHTTSTYEEAVEWIHEVNDYAKYDDDSWEQAFEIIHEDSTISLISPKK